MRTFHRFIGYLSLALASCFGFSGLAMAEVSRPGIVHTLGLLVSSVGEYGHDVAKYKAEQMYMHGTPSTRLCTGAGLTPESNGFRLSGMTQENHSGVAKGIIGSQTVALA